MTEWEILARGEDGVGISRCPEGHIHVELERGELTLRFDDARFLSFARIVAIGAAAVADHGSTSAASKAPEGRQWRN